MSLADRLSPAQHSWLTSSGVLRLLAALAADGAEARFVGGAVRDAFLGRAVGDIDLAVNVPPERVTAILAAAGIKVVPTGIAHGTVTAVVEGKGYELTTLRHDVETFGRHAKVAFTDDWQADAARRDFTFNALYADAEGQIYDYFGGRDDLAAGRVRFIGEAEARIREDVLRILRFFRFHAWFGRGAPDADGLKACRALTSLLPGLSVERVWTELGKLLLAPDPAPTWGLMRDNGILDVLLPEAAQVERLARLVEIEAAHKVAPDKIRRLAALLLDANDRGAPSPARRLHMANRESERLDALLNLPQALAGHTDRVPLRRMIYRHGAENVRDALLLLASGARRFDLASALGVLAAWEAPIFPVQGSDLLKRGLPAGPRIGQILKEVEAWWEEQDFQPSRQACLEEAERQIG